LSRILPQPSEIRQRQAWQYQGFAIAHAVLQNPDSIQQHKPTAISLLLNRFDKKLKSV
jgi:hypothetical protein